MSGGGGGNQTTTTKVEPPAWTVPALKTLVDQSQNIAFQETMKPWAPRVSPLDPLQTAGLNLLWQKTGPTTGMSKAAQDQAWSTLQGNYLGRQVPQNPYIQSIDQLGGRVNPYADYRTFVGTNPWAGQQTPVGANEYIGAQTFVGANPWVGRTTDVQANPLLGMNNPYFEQILQSALGDITQQYTTGTAPALAGAMARAGAFGGSAGREMQALQEQQLGQTLSRTSAGMRGEEFARQQGLYEADVSRRLAAQQQDLARNAQLMEADVTRRMQANLADIERSAGLREGDITRRLSTALQDITRNVNISEADIARRMQAELADIERSAGLKAGDLARQLQAAGMSAGLYQQGIAANEAAYQSERQRQMAALGMAPAIEGMDWTRIQQLLGGGGVSRNVAQQGLDAAYEEFLRQWQHAQGGGRLNPLLQALSAATGGGTTTQSGPGGAGAGSRFSNAAMGGLGGAATMGAAAAMAPATAGLSIPLMMLAGGLLGGAGGAFG
jgi:hypothetical protein